MKQLVVAHNPTADLPTALRSVPKELQLLALVSVLDSTSGVAGLPSFVPLLTASKTPYATVGTDVSVSVVDLIALQQTHEIFTGFDEVWLFASLPSLPKPAHIRLTSDQVLTSAPAGLEDWMLKSDCLAGLGDGDGLNFVTFDSTLATVWRRNDSAADTIR